jgi:acetyltransferase-like isoleucine patch superfamily enzyme
VIIGAFCSIASNVIIQSYDHNFHRPTSYFISTLFFNEHSNDTISKGDIIIEDDVWIGSNSVILGGVKIGRGTVIGAGSIVTKNIPPYSIVVGNPARVIKQRFNIKQIEKLEELKWWTWGRAEIIKNHDFFKNDVIGE